jgi:hypothetical protein
VIRPEALTALARWREALMAVCIVGAGIWLCLLGGLILIPVGLAAIALGAGLGVIALRRLRFVQDAAGPGVVELDEAQIGWLGPEGGGYLSLRELAELRLMSRGSRRFWRLKQMDGQALLIPVDASGAERLFDAFTALPGMDSNALVSALDAPPSAAADALGPVIWHRPDRPARIGLA